jgi:hypothetical protein
MKNVFIFIALFITGVTVNAQRLYIHDMLNGNYKSFGRGDRIEFTMLDSVAPIKGRITRIEREGFYINDGNTLIKPSAVASIILSRGLNGGNVLGIIGGSILTAIGTPFLISSVVLLAEEPALGVIVLLASGSIVSLGTILIVNQSKKGKQVRQTVFDEQRWRLFID